MKEPGWDHQSPKPRSSPFSTPLLSPADFSYPSLIGLHRFAGSIFSTLAVPFNVISPSGLWEVPLLLEIILDSPSPWLLSVSWPLVVPGERMAPFTQAAVLMFASHEHTVLLACRLTLCPVGALFIGGEHGTDMEGPTPWFSFRLLKASCHFLFKSLFCCQRACLHPSCVFSAGAMAGIMIISRMHGTQCSTGIQRVWKRKEGHQN